MASAPGTVQAIVEHPAAGRGKKEIMERTIDFQEIATYNHRIEIEADTEEILDCIENGVVSSIESREIDDINQILAIVSANGGIYEFIEDGSPYVEYEIL